MSKGKLIGWLLVLLVIGGLGWIKYNNIQKNAEKNTPPGAGGPPTIGATGFVTEYTRLSSTINTNGTLLALDEVQLQPEVSGRITYINIKEGSSVQKGTLLLKLNDADLQAQMKKLQAQQGIAQTNESRLKELLKVNGVSQQEYDAALNTLNNIQADMELLKAQIDKTEIRAPFNGKLGLRNVSLGAYISPSTVVTTLQTTGQLKIDITVPEKYASTIQVGDMLQFNVDGFKDPFSAKVAAIEPMIDESTRNIKLRAFIQGSSAGLVPGAFAKVQLKLKDIPDAIVVPSNAVIPDAKTKKLIVADSGKAKFVIVETGIRTENEIQITAGIAAGDTVVTSGLLQIKPNMLLKITKVTRKSDVK
jgi:membrane fusion protein, multidrug efflux system